MHFGIALIAMLPTIHIEDMLIRLTAAGIDSVIIMAMAIIMVVTEVVLEELVIATMTVHHLGEMAIATLL